MALVYKIIKEQITNFPLLFRLALFEIKGKYQTHYLGILWQFLNPFIQVCVYWLVFGIGIRGGAPVGETPYLIWLLVGLIPWFFISPTVIQGSNSIYNKVNLVSKMKFPLSSLPSITIISHSFSYGIMLLVLVVILMMYEINSGIYLLQLPYYIFCLYTFLYAFILLCSTISVLIRDFQLLLQSFIRLLFFVTPIFWSYENVGGKIETLLNLNPFAYIINGFRDAFLGGRWFYEDIVYTCYFWSLTLLLLVIGATLHEKFKDRFIDYV